MKKWILLLTILTNIAVAASEVERPPRIGLVLSGGGARGAAHIGVIEALEEMNVPIDFIVGTSMGAVIGGLYASGVPIEQIKHDFSTLKWDEIFSYDIKRTNLSYRRKLDTDIFLLKNFISYSDGAIHIPYGIITGQSLYRVFNTYLLPIQPIKNFDHLNIPFKAVATDLVSGKPIVLEDGDMALALLASMAVPGIISPIEQGNYLLVDGGVSANVPVEIAKSMKPDVLIVVDVSTPLAKQSDIVDLTDVIDQISNILAFRNVEKSKALLTPNDILIEPVLKDIDTTNFSDFEKGVLPGKIAVEKQADRFYNLYSKQNGRCIASFKKHEVNASLNQETHSDLVKIDAVAIKNVVVLEPETYFDYIHFDEPLVTSSAINKKIDTLYGLSIFDRIHYTIDDIRNEKTLVVEPIVDLESPIYFQASLLLDTDFHLTNTFGIVFAITNPRANRYLGEWRLIGQIGQGEGLAAEFYQPLSEDLAWFVNPRISIQRMPSYFYYDFDVIAELVSTLDNFGIILGRNFGHWGRLSGYWQFEYDDIKPEIGFPIIQNQYIRNGEIGLLFEWDTLDNLFFPRHGIKGKMILSNFDKAYGGNSHFSQFSIRNIAAVSKDKHALTLGTTYNRTINNVPTFPKKYALGGLFELTGLSTNQLLGDQSALISAIYFYQYKQIDLIPNRPVSVYLGGTLEAGKVWGNANISNERWIGSGGLFAAADSILGPIYLAFGLTDNGHRAVHLALRPAFR